ncbi:MAG: EamA family transporter [Candidatus Krumholzibacteria bacterium]|nr:EamA family transporter [Candidatus Krumholzibacteria bacterium]
MIHLLAASLLWAFSFGLIKGQLAGLDPVAVSCGRLLLAAVAFSPLVLKSTLSRRTVYSAMGLGMLQFGLMYVLYIASYRWLPAWMVALFTIFTPLYVVLFSDLLERRFRPRHLACAVLAVVGAGVVVATAMPAEADWRGIVLLQGANLCFATGQVYFVRLKRRAAVGEAALLGWMYVGAALLTLAAVLVGMIGGGQPLAGWTGRAWWVLLYLGLLPTALGFYLWNKGATRVGAGLLAAANNLKVPLAVLVSWLVFGEDAAYGRVVLGLAVILGALFMARKR